MKPQGGTEILYDTLVSKINPADYGINLIKSVCDSSALESGLKNIVWQHLSYDQPLVAGMQSINFTNSVDAFVYVSHWQYQQFRSVFPYPFRKGHVIKNAINPIEYVPKDRDGKLRLIYTSTPWRGLDVLLDSWEMLGRDDAELHVFSSTKIYGDGFAATGEAKAFEPLLDRAASTSGVVFHGYQPNDVVRLAVQDAHIFAYPSVFEETSCLSMIEAGAAGCSLLATNLGALPETCSEFARLLPISRSRDELVSGFAAAMNVEINSFWGRQDALKRQSDFFNEFYSWDRRVPEWSKLFELVAGKG